MNEQTAALTRATISAYQAAELEIVRVAARSITLYIEDQVNVHQLNDITRIEQKIFRLFVSPIKLLKNGDAWIYAPDHVVFDMSEDFPDEYKGKSMDQIFDIQKKMGASHFEEMAAAVMNCREGVGWYIWLPDKGREIAAWTPVKVGTYIWSIGLSVPLPEILEHTGAGKQIRAIKFTMSVATIAAVIFMLAWGYGAWIKERVEQELRQREKDIQKATERYKSIIHTVIDSFWLTDLNGNLLDVNDACCRMSGYSETELLSMNIVDLDHSMNQDEVAARIEQIKDLGYSRFESKHLRKNGTLYDVEVIAQYLVDKNDKLFIISRDITERKQMEQALKESEARFKALHNASFGGIAIHDKGVILECNQGLSEMTGYSIDQLIGMDGLLLIAETSRAMVMDNILSGYEKAYEAIGLRKNGEEYPIRVEARIIPYKGKNIRIVEFRDITEQKKAEQKNEALQEQLFQAQKMEAIGNLAGGVAHDFNNMLSIILGNIEILQEDIAPDSPLLLRIHEVKKAAERSADLTRQLLAFARKQTIAPKILNPNSTIEGMLKMLKRLIGEDIDLLWSPNELLWSVSMDPSQIDQILANLCVNARDAIKGVGKVTIETDNICLDNDYCKAHRGFLPGEFVLICVSDNGSGIDKETMEKLFDPFFTTKKKGHGTGLGLATVYGIVKQNNGFINVYSEAGQGTTFRIYIPRQENCQAEGPEISMENLPKGSETILLVEDETAILHMTQTMLERMGYTVLPANRPEEAIRICSHYNEKIHLLITDVVMPSMNGRELVQTILKFIPDIKCLYMSGYTSNVIAHRGILDQGLNFINKPFSKQALSAQLRAILDEKGE
ncbi:PAS domain S-box protein [uncultured Desulfobacter sp.]|uniref:hybrid sensor histidine kinase/response regulator n=1 Tax=uncultured Desulfobacter sp. TaxID=240139 RepID=UPI002AAB2DFE|nr:PAS domain S-box protein [uncultured Desulfobacter sp.]